MRKSIISLVLILGMALMTSCAKPQPVLQQAATTTGGTAATVQTTAETTTAKTLSNAEIFISLYDARNNGTTKAKSAPTTTEKKVTTTNTKKPSTTAEITMPAGDMHYGNLPLDKQKEYAAEREALDAAALDDLQEIKDKIEDYEDKIKSASAQNSPKAIRLQQQINQLELEKRDKVGEAMAQNGGQWSSYAETISNQYDALIAAKRQQLNSLKPDTSKLQYEIDQLKTLASLRYERYKFELQILNDKYGIVG